MATIKNRITKEEIEHIINEFIVKGMSTDLAMLFITQDDITIEDFIHYTISNKYRKVFIEMFNYLNEYIKMQIVNEKFDNVVTILYKLPVIDYKFIENKDSIDFQYMSSMILGEVIKLVTKDISTYRFEEFLNIMEKKNFELPKDILLIHWRCLEPKHLKVILLTEWLNPHDFIQVILQQYKKDRDMYLIPSIIEECLQDEYYTIPVMDNIFNRYIFTKEFKNNKVSVKTSLLYNIDPKIIRGVNMLRSAITSRFQDDAELDIYNLLENSRLRYLESRDFVRVNIYSTIQKYLFDGTNYNKRKDNFLKYSVEDSDLNLTDYDKFLLSNDLLLVDYIYEAKTLSPYQFLLRIYNVNRFRFLQTGLMEYINEYYSSVSSEEDRAILNLATNDDFWIFQNIFEK